MYPTLRFIFWAAVMTAIITNADPFTVYVDALEHFLYGELCRARRERQADLDRWADDGGAQA